MPSLFGTPQELLTEEEIDQSLIDFIEALERRHRFISSPLELQENLDSKQEWD